MLDVVRGKSEAIERVKRDGDALYLYSETGILRLMPMDERTVRVSFTCRDSFSDRKKPGVIAQGGFTDWRYEETAQNVILSTGKVSIIVDRASSACEYYDENGKRFDRRFYFHEGSFYHLIGPPPTDFMIDRVFYLADELRHAFDWILQNPKE